MKKELERYLQRSKNAFLEDPRNDYVIISGTDLAGKSTFAKYFGEYVERKVGLKNYCHVFEVLDCPFGKLTRYSLDKGLKGKMANLTQSIGMLSAYFYQRAKVVYPMRKLGKMIIQVRGSEYDLGTILSKDSLKSGTIRGLVTVLCGLTRDASEITLLGEGYESYERIRGREIIQGQERPPYLNKAARAMVEIHKFKLSKIKKRKHDLMYNTTEGCLLDVKRQIKEDHKDRKDKSIAFGRILNLLKRGRLKLPKRFGKGDGELFKELNLGYQEKALEQIIKNVDSEIKNSLRTKPLSKSI